MVREQDRFMPIANVIRIMRKVLPTHAKISDEAKETIQECVSEYISFITSEANDRCQREQRKTITAEDIIWAMSKLGFDDYIEPLSVYLQRYRELEGDHRGAVRGDALPLKRSQSDVGGGGGGGVYGAPPPYSLGQGYHGYGGGYYMGVYGDGSGGSSPQGGGAMGGGYDPYGPYN
ncbi:putative transcription factor Hap3/NF-YB family [Dioscorea sansibarensis]